MSATPTKAAQDTPAEVRRYLARIGHNGGKAGGQCKSRSQELRDYWADVKAGRRVRVGWQPTKGKA